MAARERQRDKGRRRVRVITWPTVVLAAGIILSLTANLAQAQPTPWGRVVAATPSGAFLVAVSMLERRESGRPAAVLVLDDRSEPGRPGTGTSDPDEALLSAARSAAAEHLEASGQPITRDALRARLGTSNQLASDLLRQLRATT
jgi:hypothetical protein